MKKLIAALDQGTSGTTAALFDTQGQLVDLATQSFPQHYPHPGWVEHRPEEIWESVKSAFSRLRLPQDSQIVALGITNQRETVVSWDKATGEIPYSAVVWQCRRTHEFCQKIRTKRWITQRTGLPIDPYFSASKMRWLIEKVPTVRELAKKDRLHLGTVDSYLLWRLTQGQSFATDVTNASRTQLMNLDRAKWDAKLLEFYKIPENSLASIQPCNDYFGVVTAEIPLLQGVPITGMAGDQQAALLGQRCFKKGQAKCTLGTGSFLVLNTGTRPYWSRHGLLTTLAWQLKGKSTFYALEGGAFLAGALVDWVTDELKLASTPEALDELAGSVADADGVTVIPAHSGWGAPLWSATSKGAILGLTRRTQSAHIARAIFEALAHQNLDIIDAMAEDWGHKLKSLKVDGGVSRSQALLQIQSDLLGGELIRPKMTESTALGAAFFAGLGANVFSNCQEIEDLEMSQDHYSPTLSRGRRSEKRLQWQIAVRAHLKARL